MKLASLVNLKPIKEGSMQAQELADRNSLEQLQAMRDEIFMDMQKDPSIEPEGGPVADYYGDQLNDIEAAIELLSPKRTPLTYDQAIGRVSRDEFEKSSKFDRMNEATEKSWNAVDVSRKAEKEVDNKEWNSRTTKKLDMLIALNKAGKFKKDWGEEKLQGWVDQNYSWEKISRQFKNVNEMKANKQKNLLIERFQELAGIKHLAENMQQGDYSAIEQGWDGLPWDEQRDIINTALSGEARPDDFEKDFDQLKSEIPDFESGVANYLGIDEGEDYRLEPEDMEDPDEDLVIIGSGYLDIKSNFGERPSQTNGEYAELGQKVVDQLHNGDKEAALDFIYSKINEVDEGSCGYGPDGVPGDTPGGTKGMDADDRTRGMMKKFIQKEIKKLKEGEPGDFDKGLEDLMGKDDFEKATSNEVPGIGDTVIDDKTDITTSKKTFMQMMMQFTDEPFLIETGLRMYDAWVKGEGGLKPSRILAILKDTSKR